MARVYEQTSMGEPSHAGDAGVRTDAVPPPQDVSLQQPPEATTIDHILPDAVDTDNLAEGESGPKGKPPTRGRCFHCGALTSVKTLSKTGELCWRCYRPAGSQVLRTLSFLATILALAAILLVGWNIYAHQALQTEERVGKPAVEGGPRQYSAEERLRILKRHFLGSESIDSLCNDYRIKHEDFQNWVEQAFSAMEKNSQETASVESNPLERRISDMERKFQQLDKLLHELKDDLHSIRHESGRYEKNGAAEYILHSSGPPPTK